MQKCEGITKAGKHCANNALPGSIYCGRHINPSTKLNLHIDINKEIIRSFNEETNIFQLLEKIKELKNQIVSINPTYNFEKVITDETYMKLYRILDKVVDVKRRIDLIIKCMFNVGFNSIHYPITYYTLTPILKSEEINFKNQVPHCFFNNEKAPEPEKPKATKKPETGNVESQKFEPKMSEPSLQEIYKKLEIYLAGKNIKEYLRIIMNNTDTLKYNRKEILNLYLQFHPDKVENNEISKKLADLVSSKISILKKKIDSSSSPVRPMGNLLSEVSKLLF